MLAACAAAIPRELRATVFAVATDLVLSDGRLEGHEKVFVDQLQSALQKLATVIEGNEHLAEIGRLTLWEGAQDFVAEEVA